MASQQNGIPPKQHRTRIFPSWLRIVFIPLGLICLGILAFIWIRGVSNDLDKVMSAIFVSLTAIFAFLAMPFLYRSEHSHSPALPVSTPIPPVQFTINNQFQPNVQQPSLMPTAISLDNKESDEQGRLQIPAQTKQQHLSENAPVVNQPLSPALPQTSGSTIHSSLMKKRNVLDQALHDEMVSVLEAIPAAASFGGRTTLLQGLPRNIVLSLDRDRDNDTNDLENLLTQLDGLGPLDTGEQPLIIFTQNALRRARGLAVGGALHKSLEELKRRYV